MKDGDILFFDELLNGNPATLNACLTLLENRVTISGKKLADIMIIAAANPQGMTPITPQIKERFVWYQVNFNPSMWKDYMFKKYYMPANITSRLCTFISNESFTSNNFMTPRSIDKAVNMIINDVPTPYNDILLPILSIPIENKLEGTVELTDGKKLEVNEVITWLDLVRHHKEIDISKLVEPDKIIEDNGYEIEILDENDNKIGEVKNIEELKKLYYFTEESIKKLEKGRTISTPARPGQALSFFQKK